MAILVMVFSVRVRDVLRRLALGLRGTGGVARATPKRPRRTEQGFRPASGSELDWAEKVTRPAQFGAGVGCA
ncbi:hypothetical protein ACAG24_029215, partial [Mycobacterium sp. pW049]